MALLSAGCTSRKRAPDAFLDPSCRLLAGVPQEAGTIVFALTDGVDPVHAPTPRNPSERIVFRNLYETLVLVDCAGHVGPGLAESWTTAEGGRVWTFTLRADARFWDGVEVHPESVKRAWSTGRSRAASNQTELPWPWLDADTDSVTVLDERRLSVRLPVPVGESPVFFAHPALAVADRRPDSAFPQGTGPCRIAGSSLAGGAPGRPGSGWDGIFAISRPRGSTPSW
jgi:ABC-type transport system substrate-binding protein